MAFGGRELRLFLSIQSYGTTNIARLRRDIMQLQTATEAANARAMAQARLARQQMKVDLAQRAARDVGPALVQKRFKAMQAMGRAASSELQTRARQLDIDRRLYDIESRRIKTRRLITRELRKEGRGDPGRLTDLRRTMKSLSMQQATLRKSGEALTVQLRTQTNAVKAAEYEWERLKAIQGATSVEAKQAAVALQMENAVLAEQKAALVQAIAAERNIKPQRLEQMGRRIAHIGRTAQFTGLLVSAGFGLAATAAANFETKLYLAGTQARDIGAPVSQTLERIELLRKGIHGAGVDIDGILELMQRFPYSAEDMADAAYDIYSSMEVSFGQGLRYLEKFSQVALATGGDLATATNAGITVLNNFAGAGDNINKTLNLMISVIRFGRMRLEEFNAMLEKVAPAAKGAGQSFEDLAGAMAFLTTRQPSQRVAATGLARLLQTFQDPDFQKGIYGLTDGLVDITRGAGAVGVLKPLNEVINDMAKSVGMFDKYGGPQQLFKELTATGRGRGVGRQSRIEAWRTYTFLVQQLDAYNRINEKTISNTTEFAKALAAMSESPGMRWQIFLNQLRAFVIIIGEEALPAMLKLADGVKWVIDRFTGLSEGTRQWIVWVGVAIGAGGLLLGTLTNIVGSVVALIANFRIMRNIKLTELQVEAAAAGRSIDTVALKTSLLQRSLFGLMGIGIISIPIVMQIIKGGEPGLWELLGAAGFGAAGGAMLGSAIAPGIGTLIGAGIGAIAVPITINLISRVQDDDFLKDAPAEARRAYERYVDTWQEQFKAGGKIEGPLLHFEDWLKKHPRLWKMWNEQQKKGQNDALSLYEKYVREREARDKEYLEGIAKNQKKLHDTWTKQDQEHSQAAQDAAAKAEQAVRDAAALVDARTEAMATAHERMQSRIDAAVDNLLKTYDGFKQANEEAFGSLFGGPVMGGMLGSVFDEINNAMREFGVQIPIPFELLQRDMDMQTMYFKRWRQDLAQLGKRGAPLEFIQQLQALGPEKGIPIIEGLLAGSDKQFKGIVSDWKKTQKLINNATKRDMDNQLADWLRHGKKIALSIIEGVNTDAAQAALRVGFKKYVIGTFGDTLKRDMKKEVATAMAEAIREAARSKAVDKAAEAAGKAAAAKINASMRDKTGGRDTQKAGAAAAAVDFSKLPTRQLGWKGMTTELNRINARQAQIARDIRAYAQEHGIRRPRPTLAQHQELLRLQKRENLILNRRRAYLASERQYVQRELARWRKYGPYEKGPHAGEYKFTYEGDTIYISANGATVSAVMAALNKKKFQQKSRHPKKQPQRRGA